MKILETLLKANVYVEDGLLYIKNSFKYDIYNLIEVMDEPFIEKLKKDLELD